MRPHNGFTLLELLVTLSVLGIIVGIGIPTFAGIIAGNRATSAATDIAGAFQLARSESVRRGTPVTVCGLLSPTVNVDDAALSVAQLCRADTNWAQGWLILDPALSDPTPKTLKVWAPPLGNPTITASQPQIVYRSSGRSDAAASVSLTMPGCSGNDRRIIDIAATGRVSINRAACP